MRCERLDLMITVGTVYMSIPGAPIKEIMKDMMEMTRGVQHPTRGGKEGVVIVNEYLKPSGNTIKQLISHFPIHEKYVPSLSLSFPSHSPQLKLPSH